MASLVKDLKATEGIDVRYVYGNNAGENEALRGYLNKMTMSGAPQQNGWVKRKFAILYNQV